MNYQLVLQFSGETEDDFDRLVEIETELEENLSAIADVDGHDFGSGQMNIFIFTENPTVVFERVKAIVAQHFGELPNMKAAYRDAQSEVFTVIWPNESTEFHVV